MFEVHETKVVQFSKIQRILYCNISARFVPLTIKYHDSCSSQYHMMKTALINAIVEKLLCMYPVFRDKHDINASCFTSTPLEIPHRKKSVYPQLS